MAERLFVVTLHRRVLRTQERRVIWIRHYARLNTAIRRIGELAALEGVPGDVFELAHIGTGRQLGTARLSLRGQTLRLVTEWPWD